jgi:hypothetical protein
MCIELFPIVYLSPSVWAETKLELLAYCYLKSMKAILVMLSGYIIHPVSASETGVV